MRRLREAAGMGLRELGRKTDLSPTFLSSLETGHRPGLPSEASVRRLARALGAEPDALMLAAGKLPEDVVRYLTRNPQIVAAIRAEMAVR